MRDQMKALTQSITTSARERHMAVGASRVQTARMLQAFGRERATMARTSKSGLIGDRVSRSVDVCALRADAVGLREQFRRERVHMRRGLQRRLHQSSEAVATFIADLRTDLTEGRVNLAKAYRRSARAQRACLAKDRRERVREVAGLIGNFHAARGEMAHEMAETLAKATQDVRSLVSGLHEWRNASLQKGRENTSVQREIPHYLPATQGSAAALRGTPAARQPTTVRKKAAAGKAMRASSRLSVKSKKK